MNVAPEDHFQTDLSVGEILRRTRMHYDQSIEDIERALRIRAVQLEALENGNYAALPGRVYVIGFIRSYGEYLGLDGEKMVQLYKTQSGGKIPPAPAVNYPVMAADTKMPQLWQIGLSVVAALLILTAWWSMQGNDRKIVTEVPQAPSAQIETPAPVQQAAIPDAMPPQPATVQNAPPSQNDLTAAPTVAGAATTVAAPVAAATTAAAPTAAPQEPQKGVILNIKENSWVEIRGKDGKSIVSRVLEAGDRYYVPDRPDLTISLGNSGGVELEVEGKKLKPLGAPGEVKRNIPLDGAYLKKNYGS